MGSKARLWAVTGVGIATALLVAAPAAQAGASSPPPTNGYVAYGVPSLRTSCSDGVVVSATFSIAYDATGLHDRSYQVAMHLTQSDDNGDERTLASAPVPIAPGAHGTFTRTFDVSGAVKGEDLSVSVDAAQAQYSYAAIYRSAACTATPSSVAPSVRFSRLACNDTFTETVDASRSTADWQFTTLALPGGFAPNMVSAGRKVVTTYRRSDFGSAKYLLVKLGTNSAAGFVTFNGTFVRAPLASGCAAPASRVTIGAASKARAGRPLKVTGALTAAGKALVGQKVTLLGRVGKAAWKPVATVTSGARGALVASVRPTVSTSYRWSYTGTTIHRPAASAAATVHVTR